MNSCFTLEIQKNITLYLEQLRFYSGVQRLFFVKLERLMETKSNDWKQNE